MDILTFIKEIFKFIFEKLTEIKNESNKKQEWFEKKNINEYVNFSQN
jgi:hypothetical protein